MPESHDSSESQERQNDELEGLGHPRGTLVIVAVFGALFALGWVAIYVLQFLERGAPHS